MARIGDYESYRVMERFNWDGWELAPNQCQCGLTCSNKCTGKAGSDCKCKDTSCRCACGVPKDRWGGDIWLVRPRHPRKEFMLEGLGRKAVGDVTIPPLTQLLKHKEYRKLLMKPNAKSPTPEKQKIPA